MAVVGQGISFERSTSETEYDTHSSCDEYDGKYVKLSGRCCTFATNRRARDVWIHQNGASVSPPVAHEHGACGGTSSTELRIPQGTLLEHSTPGWVMMRQHLGQDGATLNFKVALISRRPGIKLVSNPRSWGVWVYRIVQGHTIARSPKGAAIANPRREGTGGLLLQSEPSTHQISQKGTRPFTESPPNGVSGHRAQARVGSTPTAHFLGDGWNASSVLMSPDARDGEPESNPPA